jgi:hypothetical protein
MLLIDIGLAIFLVLVALFLIWQLYDFLRKDGRWRKEVSDLGLDQTPVTEVVTTQEVL